jgi:PBP1b-binding outer membrane lipoprotein LpoB
MKRTILILSAALLLASCSSNQPSDLIEITEEPFTQHPTWTEDSSDFFE